MEQNYKRLFDFKNKTVGIIRNYKTAAIVLIIVYAIALFPLFMANSNYRDDVGRVLQGYDEWDNFGRVTTNALSHVVHADEYLKDISPLTQIIAVLFIILASLVLLRVVHGDKKLSVLDAVSVLPLGLFPYFLCCFSYKYDAPYMALSVLVSVLPFAIRNHRKVFIVAVFVCTLLMFTTYQASAGIIPMVVVFTAFLDWKKGEKNKRILLYCLLSAVAFVAAMIVFFVFIPKGDSGYVSEKMTFSNLSIHHVIENFMKYFRTFKDDFRIKWFAVIAIVSAMFFIKNTIETKKNKVLTFIFSVVVFVIILAFSFGPYSFLDEPFLMPRGMYGICMFVTLICLGATPNNSEDFSENANKQAYSIVLKSTKAISCIGIVALGWMCVVFAGVYGNATSAQKSYDEIRIAQVADDLAEIPQLNGEEKATIQVMGTVGYAPGIKGIPDDGILLRLLQPPFGGENIWSYTRLLSYYGLPEMEYSDQLSNEDYKKWNIAHENCYHTIYTDKNRVLVELKNY